MAYWNFFEPVIFITAYAVLGLALSTGIAVGFAIADSNLTNRLRIRFYYLD